MAKNLRRMALVVVLLGAAALAMGLWDLLVERDGGEDWLDQALFPAVWITIGAILFRQAGRKAVEGASE